LKKGGERVAQGESETPIESLGQAEKELKTVRPIRNLFLLDVVSDRASWPVLFWAGGALLIGTLAYHWLEGWSYLDSLYFCVISLATVGYGDLTPTTPVAKVFTMVYVINGIVILLALFDRMRVVRTQRMERVARNPQAR
jgi:hypothetical protein